MAAEPSFLTEGERKTTATRKKMNQRERKERLREQIDVNSALGLLHRLAFRETWVRHEPLIGVDGRPVVDENGRPVTVEVNRVAEYNGKANIALRLLNKRIPDLKAIEIDGNLNLRGMMVNMLGVPATPTEPAQAQVLDAVYEFVDEDEGEPQEAPQALEELPSAGLDPEPPPEPAQEPAEARNGRPQRLRYRRR